MRASYGWVLVAVLAGCPESKEVSPITKLPESLRPPEQPKVVEQPVTAQPTQPVGIHDPERPAADTSAPSSADLQGEVKLELVVQDAKRAMAIVVTGTPKKLQFSETVRSGRGVRQLLLGFGTLDGPKAQQFLDQLDALKWWENADAAGDEGDYRLTFTRGERTHRFTAAKDDAAMKVVTLLQSLEKKGKPLDAPGKPPATHADFVSDPGEGAVAMTCRKQSAKWAICGQMWCRVGKQLVCTDKPDGEGRRITPTWQKDDRRSLETWPVPSAGLPVWVKLESGTKCWLETKPASNTDAPSYLCNAEGVRGGLPKLKGKALYLVVTGGTPAIAAERITDAWY